MFHVMNFKWCYKFQPVGNSPIENKRIKRGHDPYDRQHCVTAVSNLPVISYFLHLCRLGVKGCAIPFCW
jgi:hypothetical protein